MTFFSLSNVFFHSAMSSSLEDDGDDCDNKVIDDASADESSLT